jgi:hypothetical protein
MQHPFQLKTMTNKGMVSGFELMDTGIYKYYIRNKWYNQDDVFYSTHYPYFFSFIEQSTPTFSNNNAES